MDQGVLINIDSEFDFDNIKAAAKKVDKPAKTLLRINPDVDPEVCVCLCVYLCPCLCLSVCVCVCVCACACA